MQNDRSTITGWMQPEEILLDIDVPDRAGALAFMSAAIGRTHGLEPGPITRALERREQAGSTALGDGFALPHARIAGLARPLTLFMRTRTGIAFDAPDGGPVRDFLVILVPAGGDKQDHLALLARIAELFSDRAFRARLDTAADAASAAGCFRAGVAAIQATRS